MNKNCQSNTFHGFGCDRNTCGFFSAAVALFFIFVLLNSSVQAKQPNFIVILTDDQGYADIGCYGSGSAPNAAPWKKWDAIPIRTPRLDKMAAEGMRFTSFYSGCQVCTPSRAALLTGCYPQRIGLPGVIGASAKMGINPNEITLAELLKARGYAAAIFGKWHLGHEPMFLPRNHGFDFYYGIPFSNDMNLDPDMKLAVDITLREGWTTSQISALKKLSDAEIKVQLKNKVPLMRNDEVIEFPADQSTLTKRYTDEAIQFIKSNSAKPFFVYIPHTMPHTPLAATSQFAGTTARGLYGDVIAEIDWNVGRLLDSLKSLGLDENTFVIYTADNGPWLGKAVDGGTAYPWRDGKFSNFEGGFRVPCIMRWPGKIPAGVVQNEFAALIDIYPTLAKLSTTNCQELPRARIIDGVDIWSLISGALGAKRSLDVFYYDQGCIRVGNWKFMDTPAPGVLFNLATDIHEDTDVAAKNSAITADLKAKLVAFKTSLDANKRPSGSASTVIQKAGCTDKTAPNYDATAQIDDGSCRYCTTPILGGQKSGSLVNDVSLLFTANSRTITVSFTGKEVFREHDIELTLFDVRGTLLQKTTLRRQPGDQMLSWNANKLPSGLFFIQVHTNALTLIKPLYVKQGK